ncbi:MAG TPA: ATP-binding protein [Verrucomicrobiae bacterium]|nr:ATP-binding protein [Verrucomicrobiae bacterium]
MFKLKWKLTGMYLLLAGFVLFLAGVGIVVETSGRLAGGLLGIFSTALLLTVPLAYFLASGFANRINELIEGTKSLVTELSVPKGFQDAGDELGELGGNIYLVTRKLQSTIRDVSRESGKMAAILTSMIEGVVALDHVGRVVLLNRSAERMFGKGEAEVQGKYLAEMLRESELEQLVRGVLDRGETNQYEFVHDQRILRVLMSPVTISRLIQGGVLVFQDITEIRKLEQIRTEFVANVSHELRTPLTSIKGFVETLLDGADSDPEVRGRFLRIIYDETGRLQRLIEDLLTISHLENRRKISGEISSVVQAFNRVAQVLQPLALAKDIALDVRIPEGLPQVAIGEELLSQLFLNLAENSIKYTPTGGRVWLEIGAEEGQVRMDVGDTGPGIPEESLARIFERFYRVDRARSREAGGTGLGLSIVKHIVEQAQGKLHVESEVGRGTLVSIWLPIAN